MDNKDKQKKYIKFLIPGGTVLELGSGRGDFLKVCKEAGIEAAGVEKDKKAACNEGFKVFNSDIKSFLRRAKPAKYSNIYARHIVEHFFPAELRKIFNGAYRCIKKGGRFITIFPNTKNINVSSHEFWTDETHARPYPGEAVMKMLIEAGFEIIANGPDKESWDNSALKNIARGLRSAITGLPFEAPDYYVVAEKK